MSEVWLGQAQLPAQSCNGGRTRRQKRHSFSLSLPRICVSATAVAQPDHGGRTKEFSGLSCQGRLDVCQSGCGLRVLYTLYYTLFTTDWIWVVPDPRRPFFQALEDDAFSYFRRKPTNAPLGYRRHSAHDVYIKKQALGLLSF